MDDRGQQHNLTNDLALERSRASADRTLMAWIRTSLSLIGFGFTIAKLGDYILTRHPDTPLDPMRSMEIFGSCFIGLGLLALIGAAVQHRWIAKRIASGNFAFVGIRPLTETVAILLLIVGLFAVVAVWI